MFSAVPPITDILGGRGARLHGSVEGGFHSKSTIMRIRTAALIFREFRTT
jgi:hypothetical protein